MHTESQFETLLRGSIEIARLRRELRQTETLTRIQAAHIAVLQAKLEASERARWPLGLSNLLKPQAE